MPTVPKLVYLRPVKTDNLTQLFGENSTCAQLMPSGFPFRPFRIINKIGQTCPVGYTDFYRLIGMKGHNGVDFATWHLEPVYHCGMYNGWMQTAHDKDGGLNVMVVSNDPLVPCLEGCPAGTVHYIMTIYAHGGQAIGYEKLSVTPGQNIMLADNTGDSSGDHCHWAPKWCNADGTQIHLDNGYNGAFDPTPWFQDVFILDYIQEQLISAANSWGTSHPAMPAIAPQPVQLTLSQQISKILFNVTLFIQNLSPKNPGQS